MIDEVELPSSEPKAESVSVSFAADSSISSDVNSTGGAGSAIVLMLSQSVAQVMDERD